MPYDAEGNWQDFAPQLGGLRAGYDADGNWVGIPGVVDYGPATYRAEDSDWFEYAVLGGLGAIGGAAAIDVIGGAVGTGGEVVSYETPDFPVDVGRTPPLGDVLRVAAGGKVARRLIPAASFLSEAW